MGGGGSENTHGICLIIDHRNCKFKKDKDAAKKIFRDVLEYKIGEMDVPDNIDENGTKNMFENAFGDLHEKYNYKTIALVVFGKCDPQNINPESYNDMTINKSNNSFMYLDWLYWLLPNSDVPKLLIQHMWHRSHPAPKKPECSKKKEKSPRESKSEDVVEGYLYYPTSNTFFVYSKIKDGNDEYTQHPILFFNSMERVLRTITWKCDIIDLFTKVCRNVEIEQYYRKLGDVQHVKFSPHKLTGYEFAPPTMSLDKPSLFPMGVLRTHYSPFKLGSMLSDYEKFYVTEEQQGEKSTKVLKKSSSMRIELKRRKLPESNSKYPMNNTIRGFCLIINISNNRDGSFVDELRLHQLFTELYFATTIINNRTHEEIKKEIELLSTQISVAHQCLFVVLMAHGEGDRERHAFGDIQGQSKDSSYIFDCFSGCENLRGKPKVYVIQTCFGDESMLATLPSTDNETNADVVEEHSEVDQDPTSVQDIKINSNGNRSKNSPHKRSDEYRLHATIDGYKSYRSPTRGSYIVQGIEDLFRDHAAEHDLVHLMTMVTAFVADTTFNEQERQQPVSKTHTFRSFLFLNPGYIELCYPKLPVDKAGVAVEITKTIKGSVCWSAGGFVAVASNTDSKLQLIPVFGSAQKGIELNLNDIIDNDVISVMGIISGCMLSEDLHVVIYTTPAWSRKIVAVYLEKPNADKKYEITNTKLDKQSQGKIEPWKDLTQTIVNPLTICEINDDCFGVLRGTPNTYEDVTIEVYTNDTIVSIMKDTSQSTLDQDNASVSSSASSESEEYFEADDETPIQAEYVIRVKYAKGRKINLRDKLCYSRTKFYILSFYECKVYRVNVNGKIEKSKKAFGGKQPVALLRGPDDTIDVACSHAVYTDVFGKESKVFPLEDNYASNMLVLLDKAAESGKVSGRIIILNDPGMDHNTFSLIPKFELRHLKQQNVIKSSSSIKHQCVWPTNKQTNKQGVVAVGSAESCHISLASSTSKSLDQVFVDGINSAAKIVQAIHLNDSTHLVMFQTVEYENNVILKLINIDSKIEMNNDFTYRPTEENKKESFEKPAVIFGIDNHTFGVVCKVSGNGVGIRIFKRKPSSGSNYSLCKEVKLEKPCVEYMNDSACVDANGEFYISNCEKHEVNHFDVNGKLIETLRTVNSDEQPLDPYKVMVDKNNTLFILCQEAIYRLNPEKKWAEEFKFETKSKPNAVPEHTSGDGQPDSNMPSPSADQTKAMDSSPSASGALSETIVKPETTGGSWDVCFNGNFMYSVFEETLDVYGPIKCTDEALGKSQEAETEPFTDPKTPESTTS